MNEQYLADEGEKAVQDMFGTCFKSGDVKDLSVKLDILMRNPHIINSLGEKARGHVAERHDWDGIAQEHLAVYRSMLSPVIEK